MPGKRTLPQIRTRWPVANALLREWWLWVTRLDSWSWGPEFEVDDGDHGRRITLKLPPACVAATVATTITAASGSTLGQGTATLKYRSGGATLTDGPIVPVYSHMTSAVDVGTRIHVHPDGAAYMLGITDCPS